METEASERAVDPVWGLYSATSYDAAKRSSLLDWFRFEDRRILDVGCGTGTYARELRERGMEVHGITLSQQERERAFVQMERTWLANVETWEPDYPQGFFDALLLSHVLEHLVDPATTLRRLREYLRPGGRIYVAVPNIAYWRYRLRVLRGKFEYEEMGPMDKRHLRFFTYKTIQDLVEESGLELLRVQAQGHFPLGPLRRAFPHFARRLDRLVLKAFPGLFGYELCLSASNPASA